MLSDNCETTYAIFYICASILTWLRRSVNHLLTYLLAYLVNLRICSLVTLGGSGSCNSGTNESYAERRFFRKTIVHWVAVVKPRVYKMMYKQYGLYQSQEQGRCDGDQDEDARVTAETYLEEVRWESKIKPRLRRRNGNIITESHGTINIYL